MSNFSLRKRYILLGHVTSHPGLSAAKNQDNYLFLDRWNQDQEGRCEDTLKKDAEEDVWQCAGVFDGIGNGQRGEEASEIAARTFGENLSRLSLQLSKEEVEKLAIESFQEANKNIVDRGTRYTITGTTGTLLCTNGDCFGVFHMGDSRAYLFRQGELKRLTKDQTLASLKIQAGIYEEKDPLAQKEKHQLLEYIGCDTNLAGAKPQESGWLDLKEQDKLLLCSDGLYDMCTEEEIAAVLEEEKEPEKAVRKLVERALWHGGQDNITCLVLIAKERGEEHVD